MAAVATESGGGGFGVLTWTIAVAIEQSGGLSEVGSMSVWVQALVVVMGLGLSLVWMPKFSKCEPV